MPTYSGAPSVRDDFRCEPCRQKNAFHCEHDTPYRDQLLGTYDQDKSQFVPANSRRETQRMNSSKKNSAGNQTRPTANRQSTKQNNGAQNPPARRPMSDDPFMNPNYNANYQKPQKEKKSKGCTIL